MNENVKKIFDLFKNNQILSILESKNNYIVSVCDKTADANDVTETIYAVDKKTFKISEFSYFDKPDEYAEASKNIVYNHGSDDELTHWGIVGMKWGVRRYQNKDGSLTAAGKRRRSQIEDDLKARERKIKAAEKEKAAYDKLRAKSAELDERERSLRGKTRPKKDVGKNTDTRKKSISEMSDEELRERANRMMLESTYLNAQRNLANLNPPKVSAGKKFIDGLLNDVVAPAAKNAGRAWAENFMKEKLGLNKQDSLSALQKQVQEAKLKAELNNYKKNGSVNWENEIKRQTYESNKKKEKLANIQYQIALHDAKEALAKRRASKKP